METFLKHLHIKVYIRIPLLCKYIKQSLLSESVKTYIFTEYKLRIGKSVEREVLLLPLLPVVYYFVKNNFLAWILDNATLFYIEFEIQLILT